MRIDASLNLDPTALPASAEANESNHLVAGLDQLGHVDVQLLPSVEESLEPRPNLLAVRERAGLREVGVTMPLDLRIQERQDAFDVAPIPCFVAAPDELGVRARHDSSAYRPAKAGLSRT